MPADYSAKMVEKKMTSCTVSVSLQNPTIRLIDQPSVFGLSEDDIAGEHVDYMENELYYSSPVNVVEHIEYVTKDVVRRYCEALPRSASVPEWHLAHGTNDDDEITAVVLHTGDEALAAEVNEKLSERYPNALVYKR